MNIRACLRVVAVLAIFTSPIARSVALGAPESGKPPELPAGGGIPGTLEAPANFVWTGLPAFAVVDTNFTATVTAKDAQGSTLTSYAEPTTLETWLAFSPFAIGAFTSSNVTDRIYNTAFHDSRATIL